MDIIKRKRRPTKAQPVAGSDKATVHFLSWKITITDKQSRSKTYDFGALAVKRPKLARYFMHAFYGLHVSHDSRKSYMLALKTFWRFLDHMDARHNTITTLKQIDSGLIEAYLYWLGQQHEKNGDIWKPNTQRKYYGYFKELLRWVNIHYGNECSGDLTFSHGVFARAERFSEPRDAYSKNELSQIIKAIEMELEEVNIKLENPYVPKKVGCDPRVWRNVPHSPWRSWENIIWYFEHKLSCKRRTRPWLCGNGHSCFVRGASKYHGGLNAVWVKLGVDKTGHYIQKGGVGTDPTAKKKHHGWSGTTWFGILKMY